MIFDLEEYGTITVCDTIKGYILELNGEKLPFFHKSREEAVSHCIVLSTVLKKIKEITK